MVMKFTDFSDWAATCLSFGMKVEDIKTSCVGYEFKSDGCLMAYFDRELKFGAISYEAMEMGANYA